MDFKEFKEKTLSELRGKMGNGKAELYDVTKNNGRTHTGIILLSPQSDVSPVIYLEEYYKDVCDGMDFSFVVDKIWNAFLQNKWKTPANLSDFVRWEKVRQRAVVKVVNYEANKKMLETVPHKRFLNLAAVYCYIAGAGDEGLMTILIHKSHMNWWGICEEELHKTACANYEAFFETEIINLHELLKECCQDALTDKAGERYIVDMQMYVVTNQWKLNGASVMLFPDKLRELAEKYRSDLYLLPSSIHEIIALPFMTVELDGLKDVVMDVNQTHVLPEERLSDSVYRYCYESGKIVML